ncbi:MAG: hypothetical protein J6A23_10455 [Thermoguttaceae bacterium]|nr:hypothetical protein [Thermoguttaceae bacterium]
MIKVEFHLSSNVLEDAHEWLQALHLPFCTQSRKQKNPFLLEDPNVFSSEVLMIPYHENGNSTGTALRESFSRILPYWDGIWNVIQKKKLKFFIYITIPIENELPSIVFDIPWEVLSKFLIPCRICFDFYQPREFRQSPTNEELVLIRQMGEDYWNPSMLAELCSGDGAVLVSRETKTQCLDTAVWNALEAWTQSPQDFETPLKMNISVPCGIQFFDLALFLEKETVERLIKMECEVNIVFLNPSLGD